jgi:hypothetical protein
MKLIDLAKDSASLEFLLSEADDVREALLAIGGQYVKSETAEGAILDFNGDKLILLADSDEPCIIATNEASVRMLHKLANRLGAVSASISAQARKRFLSLAAQVNQPSRNMRGKTRSPSSNFTQPMVLQGQD